MYGVQILVKNKYGEFYGKKISLPEDKLDGLINLSKTFYLNGGFELTTEDSFIVFQPEIVKESILIINSSKIID
jgi:hypothetical protein